MLSNVKKLLNTYLLLTYYLLTIHLCVGRGEFARYLLSARHKAPRKILPAMPPTAPRLAAAAAALFLPTAHKAPHKILPTMPPTIAGLAAARPESPPCNASQAPLAAARGEGAMSKKKSGGACARSLRVGSQPLAFPLAPVLGAFSSPSLFSTASLTAAHRLPYRPQKPHFGAQSNPTARAEPRGTKGAI